MYNHSLPIVTDNKASDAFRLWMARTDLGTPTTGAGSPEGVVKARQFSLYIDTTGAQGSRIYIKMLPDIGGNILQGWELA
jgi:hypothetical protein